MTQIARRNEADSSPSSRSDAFGYCRGGWIQFVVDISPGSAFKSWNIAVSQQASQARSFC